MPPTAAGSGAIHEVRATSPRRSNNAADLARAHDVTGPLPRATFCDLLEIHGFSIRPCTSSIPSLSGGPRERRPTGRATASCSIGRRLARHLADEIPCLRHVRRCRAALFEWPAASGRRGWSATTTGGTSMAMNFARGVRVRRSPRRLPFARRRTRRPLSDAEADRRNFRPRGGALRRRSCAAVPRRGGPGSFTSPVDEGPRRSPHARRDAGDDLPGDHRLFSPPSTHDRTMPGILPRGEGERRT